MSDNELMNLYTEWDNYHTKAEPMVSESADNKPNQLGDELTNNVDLQTAKHIYMNNAAKLNNSGKGQLQFYGRATLDALRGLDGENLDIAMKNYYVNTAKAMAGSQLNLPRPIQISLLGMVQEQQQQQQTEYSASSSIEPEIERYNMTSLLTETSELIDDGSGENTLDQFLLPHEIQLMAIMNETEFDRYLQASVNSETLQQYLSDPEVPEQVKTLIIQSNPTY